MKKIVLIGSESSYISRLIAKYLADQFELVVLDDCAKEHTKVNGYEVFPVDAATSTGGLGFHFDGAAAVVNLGYYWAEVPRSATPIRRDYIAAQNIYQAALKARVPRVVMTGSIDAAYWRGWENVMFSCSQTFETPADNFEGLSTLGIESLGRYYAKWNGLQVICPRLGYVSPRDRKPCLRDQRIWLSNRDCISLFKCCIDSPVALPDNFLVFNAVSGNTGRVHDWQNPLLWQPQDDVTKFPFSD